MRPIKFRVWDGEKMISPDYITRDGVGHWTEDSIPTSSKILIQFTGLLDKNGKEIYADYIVSDSWGVYLIVESIRYPGAFWKRGLDFDPENYGTGDYSFLLGYGDESDLEIIGNIYENPDLLNP